MIINENLEPYIELLTKAFSEEKEQYPFPETKLEKKDVIVLHNIFEKYMENSLKKDIAIEEIQKMQSYFNKVIYHGLNKKKIVRAKMKLSQYQEIVEKLMNGQSLPTELPKTNMNEDDKKLISHCVMQFIDESMSEKLSDYDKAVKKEKAKQFKKLFQHGIKINKINHIGLKLVVSNDNNDVETKDRKTLTLVE